MYFSHNDTVVTVDGWEHRVGLGSVGFSRGVHYWEFTIEKYVPDTDPAFGVARIDVARDKMLGKPELIVNNRLVSTAIQRSTFAPFS